MADSKLKNAGRKIFDSFYSTASGRNAVDKSALEALIAKQGIDVNAINTPETLAKYMQSNQDALDSIASKITANPFATKVPLEEGSKVMLNPLKTTASGALNAIKAHPYKAGLTGLGAGLNIAGLVDNDKVLGQAIGALGGGLVGAAIPGMGPLGIVGTAMGGGALGSLFDALRAKKAQEEQYQQQYY